MDGNLTVGAVLEAATRRLSGLLDSPRLDAELLLAHVLGTTRSKLRAYPEEPVASPSLDLFHGLMARRAVGEPLAYLVGTKDFWTLRLRVGPAVLVPRPETELLVERALALGAEGDSFGQALRVADLGTGSGAIALALAVERPQWRITATDLSSDALAIAQANANALRPAAQVEFLVGSWFEPLAGRRFDLIVSNPPYVAPDDPALAALNFEPSLALTPGTDAMACLRAIVRDAPAHLERGGWLLLEHGANQAAVVARELVARGFTHVRSHRDLAGHERMTEARWH